MERRLFAASIIRRIDLRCNRPDRLTERLGAAKFELNQQLGLRQEAQAELTTVRQSSDDQFYAKIDTGPTCPLRRHDCPDGPRASSTSAEDPRREARIVQLEAQVPRHDEEVSRLEERLERVGEERSQAQARHAESARERNAKQAGIQSTIDRWVEISEEVERYERDR